jgi:ubiquinone/menaquinone biosynthesis C-methylase UbiE
VQIEDAAALIRSSVEGREGTWADLGAGRGTFTRALASILGPESRIHAVDQDDYAVAELDAWAKAEAPNVTAVRGDFTHQLELPELDGILLANALHFSKDAGGVLAKLTRLLKPGGRLVLVEYDRRASSRWVPHPISIAGLKELAAAAGLSRFIVAESRPSNYEGVIYAAHADKA